MVDGCLRFLEHEYRDHLESSLEGQGHKPGFQVRVRTGCGVLTTATQYGRRYRRFHNRQSVKDTQLNQDHMNNPPLTPPASFRIWPAGRCVFRRAVDLGGLGPYGGYPSSIKHNTFIVIIQPQALWAQLKVRGFLPVQDQHERTHGS